MEALLPYRASNAAFYGGQTDVHDAAVSTASDRPRPKPPRLQMRFLVFSDRGIDIAHESSGAWTGRRRRRIPRRIMMRRWWTVRKKRAVSYTHLTLPTICSV
eukprot:1598329-Rhodomonas_salina.1